MGFIEYIIGADTSQLEKSGDRVERTFQDLSKASQKAGTDIDNNLGKINFTEMISKQREVIKQVEQDLEKLKAQYDKMSAGPQKVEMSAEIKAAERALQEETATLSGMEKQALTAGVAIQGIGKAGAVGATELGVIGVVGTQVAQQVSNEMTASQEKASQGWRTNTTVLKEEIAKQKDLVTELEEQLKKLEEKKAGMTAGKALGGKGGVNDQLKDLRRQVEDEKKQLDYLKKYQVQDIGKEKGAIEGLVGSLSKWALGLFTVTAGLKVFKTIMNSTETTAHAFHKVVSQGEAALSYFWKTIASGDWGNFFDGISRAIEQAGEYEDLMVRIANERNEWSIKEAETNIQIGKLREETYDRSEENLPKRIKALQDILTLEKEIYTEKAKITSDELNGLIKTTAAKAGIQEHDLKDFIRNYKSYEELETKAKKYLDVVKALNQPGNTGARQAELLQEKEALDVTYSSAANFMSSLGKVSQSERDNISKVWKQMYDDENQYFTKTRRYESQLAGGIKQAWDTYKQALDSASNKIQALDDQLFQTKQDMIDLGNEKPDTEYRKGLMAAEREYRKFVDELDPESVLYTEQLSKAWTTWQAKKFLLTKQYFTKVKELVQDEKALPEAWDVVGSVKKLGDAQQKAKELQKQLSKTTDENLRKQILDDIQKNKEYIEDIKKMIKAGSFEEASQLTLDIPVRLIPPSKAVVDQVNKANKIDADNLRNAELRAYALTEGLYGVGEAANGLADEIQDVNKELSETLRGVATLSATIAHISELGGFKGIMTEEDRIQTGIQGALTMINMISSQVVENKRVMKDYYDSITDYQNEYNLKLNENMRLAYEVNQSPFMTDYISKLQGGATAFNDAQSKYAEGLKKLNDAQAITGKKNAISGRNVLEGTAAGAMVGTAILPGIGTLVGGAVGAITGLFVKKKKDIMAPILSVYPDIIKANGEFNESLAQTLIDTNKVTERTKGVLQNLIDWKKAADEAREQLKDVVSELAGSLGDDLRNALVEAFKNGTSAAEAFGDSVDKVLENIISNIVFNKVFAKAFETLQQDMEDSFDPAKGTKYDQSWTDDLGRFFKQAPELIKQVYEGLDQAKQEAGEYGINIFSGTEKKPGLAGEITRSITEETGTILAGLMRKISDDNRFNMGYNKSTVDYLAMIEAEMQTIIKLSGGTVGEAPIPQVPVPEQPFAQSPQTIVLTENKTEAQVTEDFDVYLKKLYDEMKISSDYNKIGVDHLIGIELNTYNTVAQLQIAVEHLKAIVFNTKPVYSGLGM
jgi:hypothetical protein